MTEKERVQDILKTANFNIEEIQKEGDQDPRLFKTWEYYLLVHWTNEELYYDSANYEEMEKLADFKGNTPKGTILCFS